jgi:hypothetical protein
MGAIPEVVLQRYQQLADGLRLAIAAYPIAMWPSDGRLLALWQSKFKPFIKMPLAWLRPASVFDTHVKELAFKKDVGLIDCPSAQVAVRKHPCQEILALASDVLPVA